MSPARHNPLALQEAEQQLQQSYRERDRLEKQRARLEHELANWSTKLGVDIPVPSPDSAEPSEPSATSQVSKGALCMVSATLKTPGHQRWQCLIGKSGENALYWADIT